MEAESKLSADKSGLELAQSNFRAERDANELQFERNSREFQKELQQRETKLLDRNQQAAERENDIKKRTADLIRAEKAQAKQQATLDAASAILDRRLKQVENIRQAIANNTEG